MRTLLYALHPPISHFCICTSADHDWFAWVLHYGESIIQQGGILVQCKPVKPYVEFFQLHGQPGQAVLLFPDVTSSILLNIIDYVSLAYLMKQHGLNIASPT